MSWDLIVFDFEDAQSDPESGTAVFPDGWDPPAMGSGDEIRRKISAVLPGVDWSEPAFGHLLGADFSLEFNLREKEPISSFSIYARGQATATVLKLMSATRWRMLDVSTTTWLHHAPDPDFGRAQYQALLDRALETRATTKKRSLLQRLLGR